MKRAKVDALAGDEARAKLRDKFEEAQRHEGRSEIAKAEEQDDQDGPIEN